MKTIVRYMLPVAALVCFSLALALPAFAQEWIELQPEYVYGKNRKPRLGYRKPEVFDPLSDKLYQSGYRDFPPTAIPEELKQVDALTRVQKMGRVMACADGWFWPFSRTSRKNEPPGIEIEMLRAIAKRHDWEVDVSWANTGTRFGQGLAFAKTIDRGICDIFLGVTITGDDHHMDNHGLTFTRPFLSSGFVLVVQGAAKDVKSLDEIKARRIKIGVPAYSPIHEYVRENGFENEGFFQNFHVINALVAGQIDAAMVWSGAISQARLEHPEAEFVMVKGYEAVPEMRWNSAWAIKAKEVELKQFLDEAFTEMLKTGEVRRIVERYGMPYMPPF
jgi:ABC-type amino acid transport substrate-binding protein